MPTLAETLEREFKNEEFTHFAVMTWHREGELKEWRRDWEEMILRGQLVQTSRGDLSVKYRIAQPHGDGGPTAKLTNILLAARPGAEIVASFTELGLPVSEQNFARIRRLKRAFVGLKLAEWRDVPNGYGGFDKALFKVMV